MEIRRLCELGRERLHALAVLRRCIANISGAGW
jgi:hypothetical protein